ncbi:MAG: A/G-specific adenine glycosylase [Saprospiraceae bacterium]
MTNSQSIAFRRQGSFFNLLLTWSVEVDRDMPWKKTKDAYAIWISEIILQQTQVKQAIPYYLKFICTFPSAAALADADLDAVLKVWHGLGYYSRARNLHAAAKIIKKEYGSTIPNDFEALRKLPGIGEYTAGAIASFAFELPYPAIDSNVIRFIARFLGIIDVPQSKTLNQYIKDFISNAYVNKNPALINQALIDFGATVCTAQNPMCSQCPFSSDCYAKSNDMIREIPVKKVKKSRRNRYFFYLFLSDNNHIILTQRENSDIWQGLMDLPSIELASNDAFDQNSFEVFNNILSDMSLENLRVFKIEEKKQTLTHQIIHTKIFFFEPQKIKEIKQPYFLADRQKVSTFAFPKIITDTINLWVKTT